MKNFIHLTASWLLSALIFLAHSADALDNEVKTYKLQTQNLKTEITTDIGGRVIFFGLHDHDNFLRVSDEVKKQPHPVVSPDSPNIGYFGLEIWLGPQSEWWVHQSVNPVRAQRKASWPPDPYLVQASQKLITQTTTEISMLSDASPISGASILKTFQVDPKDPNSLLVKMSVKNERKESIAWDIWFNTRVFSTSHVYVPVKDVSDVSTKSFEDAQHAAPIYKIDQGYLQLRNNPPPSGKAGRMGKMLVQPSEGWMAAFNKGQVFIIQFALQPKSLIHPEQGQIELFQCDEPNTPENSVTEMEVHAPYKKLNANEQMHAQEKWTLVEYKGEETPEAELRFLAELRQSLKLH